MNPPRLALALLAAIALAAPAGAATPAPARKPRVLPFIADDYERAVAEARARRVPLFVEAWAPW